MSNLNKHKFPTPSRATKDKEARKGNFKKSKNKLVEDSSE
jgi:hypothetical protein